MLNFNGVLLTKTEIILDNQMSHIVVIELSRNTLDINKCAFDLAQLSL